MIDLETFGILENWSLRRAGRNGSFKCSLSGFIAYCSSLSGHYVYRYETVHSRQHIESLIDSISRFLCTVKRKLQNTWRSTVGRPAKNLIHLTITTDARSALAQITRKPRASLLAESKLSKVCCMDRVLHQVRPWDPGWPRCFPSPGPLQWPHIRNNPLQVVKGSYPTKLKYKKTNTQQEYETVRSTETLADEAHSVYSSGKESVYDQTRLFVKWPRSWKTLTWGWTSKSTLKEGPWKPSSSCS